MIARLCVYIFWIACVAVILSGCASTTPANDRAQDTVIMILDILLLSK